MFWSSTGATDKSDEVSHLLSEIEQLRCTNSELRTSLQYSRKCVELMTCCSCAGKLQKSGQSRDGQTEELDAKKRDEQATSESSRRKLHSKSRSLPANHSIGRSNSRKLPPLPSESQESSVPRPASASSSPVPNTPNNPPSDIVPHPPSTPRPKGRRSRPLLVRSYTTVGISAELSAVLLDYDTMFGQPPVALWELPYRQQVYGARLEVRCMGCNMRTHLVMKFVSCDFRTHLLEPTLHALFIIVLSMAKLGLGFPECSFWCTEGKEGTVKNVVMLMHNHNF